MYKLKFLLLLLSSTLLFSFNAQAEDSAQADHKEMKEHAEHKEEVKDADHKKHDDDKHEKKEGKKH